MWESDFSSVLLLSLLAVTCAGSASPSGGSSPSFGAIPAAPKRIVVAMTSEPVAFYPDLVPATVSGAAGALQNLVHPGMSLADPEGTLRPMLGDAVPSVENGLWKVLPDGTMETSHTIRAGATWHDGTPFTSADLVFAFQVVRDRELPVFRNRNIDFVGSVEPVDSRTAKVKWKQPFIDADTMFNALARPLPRHLLEEAYQTGKGSFADLRYWTEDFVGLGPFRLKEWARGSHIILAPFEAYVLGRPKLDEIRASFIGDANTIVANLLAGSVDLPLGTPVSIDQALSLKEQWQGGKVIVYSDGWLTVYAQMLNPTPTVVLNAQFRKAMMYALDRQQLADTLMGGLAPIADSVFSHEAVEYRDTAASIVPYGYDPRKALDLLDGLGYRKGAEGVLIDGSGQKLTLEVRTYANREIHPKTLLPVVDYWKQLGVAVDPVVRPNQAATDLQEQATFPSFLVLRQPNGLSRIVALRSSQARVAETNYNGNNNGRYLSPELDALIDRFQTTIPRGERMAVAGQVVHQLTDQLPLLPLFYEAQAALMNNRVLNVAAQAQTWNAHEWDVA